MDLKEDLQVIIKLADKVRSYPDNHKAMECLAIKVTAERLIEDLDNYHIIRKTRCRCEDE
jgi:hypothetical protein